MDGNDMVFTAKFAGPMKSLTYRLKPNGWLSIDYLYSISGPQEYFGVGFDYPEDNVKSMRFLGEGPAPVYQNRLAGGTLDVWNRPYNNTVDGDPEDLKPGEHFDYPLFKGFYSGVRWLQLNTSEGPITAMVDQDHGSPIYVQVFTPKTPPPNLVGQTRCHSRLLESPSYRPFRPSAVSLEVRNPLAPWGSRPSPRGSTRGTSACTLESCQHDKDHGFDTGHGERSYTLIATGQSCFWSAERGTMFDEMTTMSYTLQSIATPRPI